MPKSNAERQAKYRYNRGTAGENGERRINMWVTTQASLALKRLSKHQGIPQRQILERLIIEADAQVWKDMEIDTEEWDKYFLVTA